MSNMSRKDCICSPVRYLSPLAVLSHLTPVVLHLPLKGGGRQAQRAGRGSHFSVVTACRASHHTLTPTPTLPLSGGGSHTGNICDSRAASGARELRVVGRRIGVPDSD